MGSIIDKESRYSQLAASVSEAAEALDSTWRPELNERRELAQACEKLASRLQSPVKRIEDLTYAWTELAAIKIALDMGIFDVILKRTEKTFTAADIASHLETDPVLVERILRALAVSGLLHATPTNSFKPDPSVKEFASDGPMKHRIVFACDVAHPVGTSLPQFLTTAEYRSPENPYAGPFQHHFQTKDHCFTWLQNHPVQQLAFNRLMHATTNKSPYQWYDIFPAADRFQPFRSPGATQKMRFVDIGGGVGHDILGLIENIPDLQAQFILQESPQALQDALTALESVDRPQQVQLMPHDFFNPQPVKGAHVYFLGRVLHTFPNPQCRQILSHIQEAMDKDSILLIHDRVLPDLVSDLCRPDIASDIMMMILHTAMERSEAQFRELLGSVGLDLVRVWKPQGKMESNQRVLEAVRRE